MVLRKDRQAAAKSLEVMDAISDANVAIVINGKACGGEIVPAVIAAGVVVGSKMHTDKGLRSMDADEIVKIVMETAAGIEKAFYDDFHRKTYEMSRALAEEKYRDAMRADAGEGDDTDENLEELDRILAQQSLDDEPEKSGE